MIVSPCYLVFCLYALVSIVPVHGQKKCEDFSADAQNCTKFIRCFHNLRIKFTCGPGTAWEDTLKTCVWKEYVESCGDTRSVKQRVLGDDSDLDMFEAAPDALKNVAFGRTLVEARALGPIVTPKQYRCSMCSTGMCGMAANTIQCYCGPAQCQPAATFPPQPRNPCLLNPCLNGGQCISQGDGFICSCPSTFAGNRCEAPANTPCQPNPCLYGGICTPQGNTFVCQCPPNYTGRCCEILAIPTTLFNPCAQAACQNGARCVPAGTSFLCQCPSGFYGARCETRNYCMPNPCANNGLCTQTTTGYLCSCSYPYSGTNCQQMVQTTAATTLATRAPCGNACACVVSPCPSAVVTNPCAPNPCQNMGGCGAQTNMAQCFCANSFYGYYCQFRRNGRSLLQAACNKTCLNGGQCYLDEERDGQAQCSCPNEFYGSRCERMNAPKSCLPKNPCLNNAKCVSTKTGSKCVCAKGTSGILCEKLNRSGKRSYCPLDCQAGGTCVFVQSTPRCRCPKNRTGRLCESSSPK